MTHDPVCLIVTVSGTMAKEAVRVLVVSEGVRMMTSLDSQAYLAPSLICFCDLKWEMGEGMLGRGWGTLVLCPMLTVGMCAWASGRGPKGSGHRVSRWWQGWY